MNTENTKLLDLQTGKYLELGKDWGYFGKYITLIKIHTKTLIGAPYTIPLSPTQLPDYPTLKIEEIVNEIKVCIYNHTDPIINQVAEKVGAVVYGGRYVLLTKDYNMAQKDDGTYFYGYVLGAKRNYHIFEECSKQLRNEPNKFEELKKFIK